jgi:iron complex transport system permease protein
VSGDNKTKEYADRIIARAKELRSSYAFEAPLTQIGTRISAAQAKATTAMHKRNYKHITIAFVIAIVVVGAISLCLPYYGVDSQGMGGGIYSPKTIFAGYKLWFKLNILTLFDSSLSARSAQLLSAFSATYGVGTYTLIMNRAIVTLLVIMCGIMLALSGMLFQTSFKNPLAAPTMLGVSDGVTLGCIVYTMLGYVSITDKPELYTLLVYGFGALMVAVVLGASRLLSGGKRYNVLDMLLLGTVLCQLLGGASQFIQTFVMDDTTWATFYDVQQASNALIEPLLQYIAIAAFLICIVIVFINRFKFNFIAFSDEEGIAMGVRPGLLRALALVLGSAMQLVALASIGQVAMLSMAVPFLVRFLMPSDFKSQFIGNCLVGSLMLLVCFVCQHFAVIGYMTMPVGSIVSIVIVPFFVWVVALSKGGWK